MSQKHDPFEYIRTRYQMPWLKKHVIVRTPEGLGVAMNADTYVHVRLSGQTRAMPWHPNDVEPAQ